MIDDTTDKSHRLVCVTASCSETIKTEKRRWFILLGLCCFTFSNAMPWATYALIIDETEKYYNIGPGEFLQFANVFLYTYVILSIPVSHYMTNNLTWIVMVCVGFNGLGGFLRWFAGNSYAIAMTGQTLASIAQCCLLQLPVVIAERWFPVKERGWALLIATFVNYLGWAFGNIAPCYYFNNLPHDEAFNTLLLHQMFIMILPAIILGLCLRSKPENPPSYAALIKSREPPASLKYTLTKLMTNKRFVINAICLGYLNGIAGTVTSVSSYILEPRHYSNLQMGNVGTAFLITGVIGGIAGALYLEYKKSINYDLVLKILFATGLIGILGLAVSGDNASFPVVLIFNALAGLGFIAYSPFGFESLVETSFPISESMAVAMMINFAQVFGFILNEMTILPFVGNNGYWFLTIMTIPVILYGLFGFKTDYKRTKSEAKESMREHGEEVKLHETTG